MVKKKIKSGKIIWLLSNQSGMALLTTLIFVFILVTFGVSLLAMTSNEIKHNGSGAITVSESNIDPASVNIVSAGTVDTTTNNINVADPLFVDNINGTCCQSISRLFVQDSPG